MLGNNTCLQQQRLMPCNTQGQQMCWHKSCLCQSLHPHIGTALQAAAGKTKLPCRLMHCAARCLLLSNKQPCTYTSRPMQHNILWQRNRWRPTKHTTRVTEAPKTSRLCKTALSVLHPPAYATYAVKHLVCNPLLLHAAAQHPSQQQEI